MKKTLSVILAMLLIIGIFAVGVSAEAEPVPVDATFYGGDIIDEHSLSKKLSGTNGYVRSITFDTENGLPIKGDSDYFDEDMNPDPFYGIDFLLNEDDLFHQVESISFKGTAPIFVVHQTFSGSKIKEITLPDNLYGFNYYYGGYTKALAKSQRTGEPLKSDTILRLFGNSLSLEKATVDADSDIHKLTFYNCPNLSSVIFTDKVINIGEGMFVGCTSLQTLDIPVTVKNIDKYAFLSTGLKSVYIPPTVTTIGQYSFGYLCDDSAIASDNVYYKIMDKRSFDLVKDPDFKIYGVSGSTAEQYAYENGFEFIEAEQTEENKVYSVNVTKQAETGETAEIAVSVSTGADKVRFKNSAGQSFTYTRDNVNVKSIEQNSSVTETWTINLKVYKPSETYNVKAKYGKTWTADERVQFTLNELNNFDKKVYSAQTDIPALIGKYAKVNVTVGGSPSKIQFRDSNGNTITYTRDKAKKIVFEANNTSNPLNYNEIWTVKVKVYKPTEDYTVVAKYGTGWSGETASFTLKELVNSSADITFEIDIPCEDYSYDDTLYINTVSGTKRIVYGNVYEGDTGYSITREWVESFTWDIYNPEIHNMGNGREKWELPNGTFLRLLDFSGELRYISVEMYDGSWAVKGYYGGERHNGYRYEPYVTMAETEPGTEPAEEPVKALNFAQAVSQSEIGGYVYVFVNASKGASKIQFANSSGSTITYTRSSSAVNSISQSGDNEIWAISLKVYRPSDTYTVKAKYGKEWITGSGITFTVTAQ